MKLRIAAAAAALAWACAAGTAGAKDLPAAGMTVEEVAAWLKDQGYKAEVEKSGDEASILSMTDGMNFRVSMYDCKQGRCRSMQFWAGFDLADGMTLAEVNAWNRGKRYLKAYLDDEMDPYVDYDVNLSPGVTEAGLNDAFGVWLSMLPEFGKHIGWE